MNDVSLIQIALLLAAAAIAAPLARWLRIGTVLGYLAAGVALGPFGIGQTFSLYQAKEILHIAEFGVVLLLFIIGLELRPTRLWSMRASIFGLGGAQVAATSAALAFCIALTGQPPLLALFLGLALSLSSTAFVLQVLEEKGELTARHGRLAFSVLLFQDLAAIPLIALVPVFAVSGAAASDMSGLAALQALATIAAVVVVGHFVLDHALRLVARTGVKEAMTAAALLTVVGAAVIMQWAGLSASLGAFIAGALLAESSYRHQLQADIQPFEGLLLGLFFTAIGMSLKVDLLMQTPWLIAVLTASLITLKAAVMFALGHVQGMKTAASRRLALVLAQGGEFAFVLLTQGVAAGVLESGLADLAAIVVTLSMAATPLLLLVDDAVRRSAGRADTAPEALPENEGHVVIAGFGRVGQITARILRAKRINFTALDLDPEQVELVRRFGSEAFYGDASRPEILDAAKLGMARVLLIAVDDIEASVRIATFARQRYPKLKIVARARNRNHVHRLMDAGIEVIQRETLLSSLVLAREVLDGLGIADRDVRFAIDTFKAHDERRLVEDYRHYTDVEKLQSKARTDAENLARLFDEDSLEQAAGEQPAANQRDRSAGGRG
ncbi:MAG: cation:proton antiporter [Hyphomicrobiaceae bacterium]|nr:cation:proton antiporter [Hyphomicrobiaceae bacterium]